MIVGLFVGIALVLGGPAEEPEPLVIYFDRKDVVEYHFGSDVEVAEVITPFCDSPHHKDFIEVAALAYSAGFSRSELHTAVAVAYAESGGDPSAVNRNRNGSVDSGLWQINSVHGFSGLKDSRANAHAAFHVWELQGWSAWYAHTPRGGEYGSGVRFLKWVDESSCSLDVFLTYMVQ